MNHQVLGGRLVLDNHNEITKITKIIKITRTTEIIGNRNSTMNLK